MGLLKPQLKIFIDGLKPGQKAEIVEPGGNVIPLGNNTEQVYNRYFETGEQFTVRIVPSAQAAQPEGGQTLAEGKAQAAAAEPDTGAAAGTVAVDKGATRERSTR